RARPADGARRTVLVVGGSQGAHGLNEALRRALPGLRDLAEKIRFTHLAGDADKEDMEKAYREEGFEAEVYGYSERLPELMARSDLAIGRAGGTTLAEIAVVGLPAILVPYPYHRDLHQRRNAEAFVEAKAARILEERDLDAGSLRKLFDETLAPGTLEAMERGAFALARPEAADAVLDLALEVLRT
ncbi:MAG: UDP-N-acetylglucosamine--N-acetylmuramyl-(pentapeptide) pyrophosphoryl-undecaprenol N-acetylglucosamine transferase, partial [Planctomycetota bacterium]